LGKGSQSSAVAILAADSIKVEINHKEERRIVLDIKDGLKFGFGFWVAGFLFYLVMVAILLAIVPPVLHTFVKS
jgi:hypothetical protein